MDREGRGYPHIIGDTILDEVGSLAEGDPATGYGGLDVGRRYVEVFLSTEPGDHGRRVILLT